MRRLSATVGHHSPGPSYERHRPEETVLFGVVQAELQTFLAQQRDRPLPGFIERESRGFLECGIFAHGFLRVHCDACGRDRIVAFSCKGRGFCPSCLGRRMAETAAHLVDRVLPEAPVRQWVLTLPFALRYRLAYDAALTSVVLREFVRGVFASYRRRARQRGPIRRPRGGAVTFIQRFGDALNLNVHFHTLMLDGIYDRYGEPGMRFRALPPPDDDEVRHIVERIGSRVARLMERRGLDEDTDPSDADPLAVIQPHLAGLAADSVRGLAPGGRRPARRGDRVDPEELSAPAAPRCAAAMGFTLHADVAVPARDRRRLERLCRYVARPPVATDRLERLPDGRLLNRLRHRWRDGTTQIVFEPQQLLGRLVPLIPAPRAHQVRYHGVLAPCASWRNRIVPEALPSRKATRCAPCKTPGTNRPEGDVGPPAASARGEVERSATGGGTSAPSPVIEDDPEKCPPGPPARGGARKTRRYAWADLLRRVFAVDVLECPECGGRLRIMAAIHPPEATRAILECFGLPSRPPPAAPARPQPAPADY